METIQRIRFSVTKYAQVRWYGISKAITNRNESFTAEQPSNVADWTPDWRSTFETTKVINRLLALPGITHLRFGPYEVNVTLASVFDWTDVHEDIIAILKEEYFSGLTSVSVESQTITED